MKYALTASHYGSTNFFSLVLCMQTFYRWEQCDGRCGTRHYPLEPDDIRWVEAIGEADYSMLKHYVMNFWPTTPQKINAVRPSENYQNIYRRDLTMPPKLI